jgi:hypothetical protein
VNRASKSGLVTDTEWQGVQELVEEREQSLMREQTVQGSLGQTGEIHTLAREASERLTDRDMREVMTDILTGLENNVFRPDEEGTIEQACEMILEYPDMVRDIDDQVAQRDGWQQLESLSERAGTVGNGDGVEIRPLAIARYVDGD